jgi:diguanylate cyclase (GGDEF)-like protein
LQKFQGYHYLMTTLIEHILKLTDHRERDLLEMTLSKALIDLLPIQRIIVARVMRSEGEKRWFEVMRLDARGGGKVADRLRMDFAALPRLEDAKERFNCLQSQSELEIAWAGEAGPRITYFPLFSDSRKDDEGVIEVHSEAVLTREARQTIDQLRRIYRNMYRLLEYSDRDALTGLLNRKSLDDAFYSAVLEALDGVSGANKPVPVIPAAGAERRHRVPANYWLGSAVVDNFGLLNDMHGHLIAEEVLLLVARIMNNTFRTYDQIYRFGGEHFGVLMHCPLEDVVLAAFDRFRANVEKFNFPQVGRVTVSCGFTSVMADDSPSTALEKTERAVEFARKHGGNKAASHLDLVRRGFFGEVTKVGAVDIF